MTNETIAPSSVAPRIFAAIAAITLVAALGNWPYGYYQLLRWFVCAVGVHAAYSHQQSSQNGRAVMFGAAALLFNPILPIHMDRSTWHVADLAFAAVFASAAWRQPTTRR